MLARWLAVPAQASGDGKTRHRVIQWVILRLATTQRLLYATRSDDQNNAAGVNKTESTIELKQLIAFDKTDRIVWHFEACYSVSRILRLIAGLHLKRNVSARRRDHLCWPSGFICHSASKTTQFHGQRKECS
jgi:lipopolysaccharide biosynthesis protein